MEMELVFNETGQYCRSTSPEAITLCSKLGNYYNAVSCVVPSGMCAISTVLHATCRGIKRLIYSDELYTDSPRLFKDLAERYNLELHQVNMKDTTQILKIIQLQEPTFLFFETCSNPHGYIFDFDLVSDWKLQNPQLLVIADNTWVTSCVFNPLDHGADFVVSSLTKYYSAGQALGGMIASRLKSMESVEQYIRFHGLHTSRYNCQVVNMQIDTLKVRITKAYSTMQELFILLKQNNNFHDICHPSLDFHKSNSMYQKYFPDNIGPCVFTLKIRGNRKKIKSLIGKFRYIKYKTSFGDAETRFDPWHIHTKGGSTECRIAVGYESSASEIYEDLTQSL